MIKRLAAAVPVVVAVALTLRLSAAFLGNDFTFVTVVAQSRQDAAWYYRLAGAWASAEGSLLCFAAVVGVVGWWGTRHDLTARLVSAAVTASLVVTDLAAASPFDRLAVPGTAGMGMTPILEHPAMAIHPPLLYLGLAATLPPFAGAVAGCVDLEQVRRQLLTALSVITVAIGLGAWWSYAEQGWGGYWAWDPVENASLAAWLGVVLAVHALSPAGGRRNLALAGIPWLVALFGAASSRSGAVPSVHGFAEAATVGWALAGIGVVGAAALFLALRGAVPEAGALRPGTELPVVIAATVLLVVAIGIAAPYLAQLAGHEIHVAGTFYARLLLPIGIAAVAALGVLAVRRRGIPRAAWLAHGGFVVLMLGVLLSTGDRSATATLAPGERATLAGIEVEHRGLRAEAGPRAGTEAVVADLVLDGTLVHPSLVAYPLQGGVLAETVLLPGLVADAQAVLVRADDDGRALYEIRRKPGVNVIWAGAIAVAGGAGLSCRRRRLRSVRTSAPACVPTTR